MDRRQATFQRSRCRFCKAPDFTVLPGKRRPRRLSRPRAYSTNERNLRRADTKALVDVSRMQARSAQMHLLERRWFWAMQRS